MTDLTDPIKGSKPEPLVRLWMDEAPHAGRWNMAADEWLLESALETGLGTLRWYRWSAPTLSLGYFQRNLQGMPENLRGLPTVVRLSGGGAILHHHEWTYSCALPAAHSWTRHPPGMYRYLHECVMSALRALDLPVRFRTANNPAAKEQFLCFARGDEFDLVAGKGPMPGEFKVLGSAQRRRKGAVLQHGSLLLRTSSLTPRLPGLFDCLEREVGDNVLLPALAGAMCRTIGSRAAPWQPTRAEQSIIDQAAEPRPES